MDELNFNDNDDLYWNEGQLTHPNSRTSESHIKQKSHKRRTRWREIEELAEHKRLRREINDLLYNNYE